VKYLLVSYNGKSLSYVFEFEHDADDLDTINPYEDDRINFAVSSNQIIIKKQDATTDMLSLLKQPILRCIWCMKDTKTNPCEHCGSDQVVDKTKRHKPHWSRFTINTIKCKICDRQAPYEQQLIANDMCNP